mmetsp:Transcript_37726/g.117610  ORF Transcript_37726/g.117610 Transcript_37726/m.117610 type:complete len:227 (-) Transcript_37726:66-746(-)
MLSVSASRGCSYTTCCQAWSLSIHIIVVVASHISLEPGTGATATAARHTSELWSFSPMDFAWKARRREDTAPCCCSARVTSLSCRARRVARWCMSRCLSISLCTSRGLTPVTLNQPARSTSSKSRRSRSSSPRARIARSSASKSPSHMSRRPRSSSHCFRSPTGRVLAVCSLLRVSLISSHMPLVAEALAWRTSRSWSRDSSRNSMMSHLKGGEPRMCLRANRQAS